MKNTKKMAASTCRTETVTVHTLCEAVAAVVLTFDIGNTICALGGTDCSVSDLVEWMATLPAAQCAARRYVTRFSNITDPVTGLPASRLANVGMLPANVRVRRDGTARLKRGHLNFSFAQESICFLQTAPGYDTMRWVRPVALGEDGLEFDDGRLGAAS